MVALTERVLVHPQEIHVHPTINVNSITVTPKTRSSVEEFRHLVRPPRTVLQGLVARMVFVLVLPQVHHARPTINACITTVTR